jgi:hypothetical protein
VLKLEKYDIAKNAKKQTKEKRTIPITKQKQKLYTN